MRRTALLLASVAAALLLVSRVALAATKIGGPGDDVLIGTNNPDLLDGRGGDDVIHGKGGDDCPTSSRFYFLIGGTGDDDIYGNGGDDCLYGGGDLLGPDPAYL